MQLLQSAKDYLTSPEREKRLILTSGVGISLLLALNLGIIIHSYALVPPFEPTEVITYFLSVFGAIAVILYKTILLADINSKEYVETLLIGVGSGISILLYLPSFLLEPLVKEFQDVFGFFVFSYIISVLLVILATAAIVKAVESYYDEEEEDSEDDSEEAETTEE